MTNDHPLQAFQTITISDTLSILLPIISATESKLFIWYRVA
jgi:hypothetical protein